MTSNVYKRAVSLSTHRVSQCPRQLDPMETTKYYQTGRSLSNEGLLLEEREGGRGEQR